MSFSNQSYASPGNNLWVSNQSAKRIQFEELSNPPLAQLDKHVLYVLNDDKLYYDGQEVAIGTGAGGDVSSNTKPSRDLSIPVYDGITGEEIKETVLSISEPTALAVVLKQWDGFSNDEILRNDTDYRNLTLGTNAGPADLLTNGTEYSVMVGYQSGGRSTNVSFSESTFVGYRSGSSHATGTAITAIGHEACDVATGSYNTAVGTQTLLKAKTSYGTAVGYRSQYNVETVPGVGIISNTTFGALSVQNLQKGLGNNAFGFRALEGNTVQIAAGPRLNNSMGNYNGLSATDGFENNIMIGNSVLNAASAALGNVIVGNSAGEATGSGSNYNIYLGNGAGIGALGVESRVIRIGASADNTVYPYAIGKPTDCYIQGIHNRDAGSSTSRKLVSIDANGKLYGMTLGRANPYVNGWFQNYTTLHIVPTTTSNLAVLVDPTLNLLTPGTYFNQPSAGTITYLGADTVDIKATVQISYRITGGANQIFDFIMYRSGSPVNGATLRDHADNASQYHSATLSCIISSVATNTNLQIYAANIGGIEALAIGNINVTYEVKF